MLPETTPEGHPEVQLFLTRRPGTWQLKATVLADNLFIVIDTFLNISRQLGDHTVASNYPKCGCQVCILRRFVEGCLQSRTLASRI